jgi:arylsulfatase A-like enzyme
MAVVAEEPRQAGAGMKDRGGRNGVLTALVGGAALAVLAALGIVAVDGVVAFYSASYFPWSVVGLVAAFWAAAGLAGGALLSIVALPAVLLVKGRARAVIPASAVIAVTFFLHALVVKAAIADGDPLGGDLLLDARFLAAWAAVIGMLSGVIAHKSRGGFMFLAFCACAVLAPTGMAPFVPPAGSAAALAIGPLAAIAAAGAAVEKISRPGAKRAVSAAASVVLAVAFVAAGAAEGTGPLPPMEEPAPMVAAPPASPNVVLVVIDTLRVDHVSHYGYPRPTTPRLDRFAKDCRVFTKAVSVDSCTLPAHASLFTGMYPRQHGACHSMKIGPLTMEGTRLYSMPLAPSRETLATRLGARGYATWGIAANYARLCRQLGIGRGFQYYRDMPRFFFPGGIDASVYKRAMEYVDDLLGRNGKLLQPYISARTVTRGAQRLLERRDRRPFFLFLNYMDAHYPYSGVPPFDKIDGPDIPYDKALRKEPWQQMLGTYLPTGEGLTPALLRSAINHYDGGVAYADHWIGELLDDLERRGLYRDALIIVTSDHGEFFSEHQILDHSTGIYEEGVRIPLMVKYPGGAHAGETIGARVSIMDIFATVLEVAGAPAAGVPAQPLERVTHPIILEKYRSVPLTRQDLENVNVTVAVLYDGDYKYIKSSDGNNELYDLARDPKESDNLFLRQSDLAARLDAGFSKWLAQHPPFDPTTERDVKRPGGHP